MCPVAIRQPQDEVESEFATHLLEGLLAPGVIADVLRKVRRKAEAAFPRSQTGTRALEGDLASLKAEQKKLAGAVAMAPDVAELVAELRTRSERIKSIEAQLAVARRAPAERAALIDAMEAGARVFLDSVRDALEISQPDRVRLAYQRLFPGGLRFHASAENGNRRVWIAEGVPELAGATFDCDPTGKFANRDPRLKPFQGPASHRRLRPP